MVLLIYLSATVIALIIVMIIITMIVDSFRIQDFFNSIEGKIIDKSWQGIKGLGERQFKIHYEDKDGFSQDVLVRTSKYMRTYIVKQRK
jgi:ABC-type siderophore export system fused ATPase/permease subunit